MNNSLMSLRAQASLLCAVMLFSTSNVFAHATIGVFDFNRAMFSTAAWEQEMKDLEAVFSEDTTAAETLREELLSIQENLTVNGPTLSANEIQRIQDDGQFKQLKYQQISERVQSSLQANQNQFLERYRGLLGEALNDVYEAGEYDLILRAESIVVSGFTFDITSEITAKLNDLISNLSQSSQ